MMAEQEQVRPLAPAAVLPVSDGATAGESAEKTRRRRKHIRCMGCVAATFLVLTVIGLILALTVFRVKEPTVKMNGVKVTRLDVAMGTTTTPPMQIPRPLINMTMVADVSVKNPNAVSFKYGNTTTEVYYRGTEIGEARGPAGKARARRTMRMSMSMDIMADRFLSSGPDLVRDVASGMLNVSTYTRIGGRVTILGFVKKHVTIMMNCTITVSLTSRDVPGFKCKRKVHL